MDQASGGDLNRLLQELLLQVLDYYKTIILGLEYE